MTLGAAPKHGNHADGAGTAGRWWRSRAVGLNARVGAVALLVAAVATLALSVVPVPLSPLRLFVFAVAAFGTWTLADELGLRKPLNRAGMVLFALACVARVQLVLGVPAGTQARYGLFHAGFLMLALMMWSVAFVHRRREMKVAGTVGIVATAGPILALLVGHLSVGVGALLGVGELLDAAQHGAPGAGAFLTTVERVYAAWSALAAVMLWRGHVVDA